MKHSRDVFLSRLLVCILAVILLIPPAAFPIVDPVPFVDPIPFASAQTSTIFSDDFDRSNSNTVGNNWTENDSGSGAEAKISNNRLHFDSSDNANQPCVVHSFTTQNSGSLEWSYLFDFERTGSESNYGVYMDIGNNLTCSSTPGGTAAVELVWASPSYGMDDHEGFGYSTGSGETQVAIVSEEETISVVADLDDATFDLDVGGTTADGVAFTNDVDINTVRFYLDNVSSGNFGDLEIDDVSTASVDSGSDGTTLGAPTNLSATAGDAEVSLSWTAPGGSTASEITFDSVEDNSGNLCSSDSCSISIDVADGSNRMILVGITDEDSNPEDVSSIDVDSNDDVGISVGSSEIVTGTGQRVELWRIMDEHIETGSNSITVNFDSSVSGAGIIAMSFSGVAQQAEEAEESNTNTSSNSISQSITTQTDGALIVSLIGNGQSGSYSSHGTGQTERADFTPSSAVAAITTEIKDTAGSDTQSHTASTSANRQAQFVAAFAPAQTAAITDYLIEVDDGDGWETFADGTSTDTTATVTGLTNGQQHSFRVSAINDEGTGNASSTVTATPNGTATVPGQPLNISATAGDGQVDLSWTTPNENGGAAIDYYVIQYRVSGTADWTTFGNTPDATTSSTVTGLTNDVTYEFQVLAHNSAGNSNPSGAANATPVSGSYTLPLSEEFTSLSLNTAVDENISSSILGWTHDTPSGWSIQNSPHTSNSGTTEWRGWSFTTMEFWTAADQQDRGAFSKASGTFAVADPDEWDDVGSPANSGFFDSTLSSPSITIPSSDNELAVSFDSHYKQEGAQTAQLTASFADSNGSVIQTVELLRYDDDSSSDNGGSHVFDTAETLTATIPANTDSVVLSWKLFDAANNWYWAIDNVAISSGVASTGSTTIEVRVNHNHDDAEEQEDTDVDRGSSDLELTEDGGDQQQIGIRFNDVAIPSGAIIQNAYVQFTVDETDDDDTSLQIFGEDTDDSDRFTNGDANISSRTKTSASVSWSPAEWDTVGEAGSDQRTPNLASVIQEIVDRAGWEEDNSLSLIITGTGQRTAESHDGDSDEAPLLVVTYSFEATTPGAPTNLSATAGNEQVSLSWTAPSDGGSDITDYVIEVDDGDGWETFADGTSTDTTATVTGLTNNQEYSFRASAVNDEGTGNASGTVTATPVSDVVLPGPPTNLSATAGNAEVSLSWVAPGSSDGIYVTDTDNHRIQVFNSAGAYQSQFGSDGDDDGEFDKPTGIFIDGSDNIFVADTDNHRIQKFSSDGTHLLTFGSNGDGNGEFDKPTGVTVNDSGFIGVIDKDNHRYQVFNSAGVYQTTIGSEGDSAGEFDKPYDYARGTSTSYITEEDNHRVTILNSDGSYNGQFGSEGDDDGEFDKPQGIAIDSSGNVYVADTDNHRTKNSPLMEHTYLHLEVKVMTMENLTNHEMLQLHLMVQSM